jgi:hypothetical protein
MSVGRLNYPYPVLGNADDVLGSFHTNVQFSPSSDFYDIDIAFGLEHTDLESMIQEKQACFAVEIVCPSTFHRSVVKTSDTAISVSIPAEQLRDRVEMSTYIISLADFDDFIPAGIHPDLAGEPFVVESGDILAISENYAFLADPQFDPLRDSAASFIKVRENTTQEKTMDIEPDARALTIMLSSTAYKAYEQARQFEPDVIHSAVVLPVLADVLGQLRDGEADFLESPWCDRLREMIVARNLEATPALEAAEELLGDPILRTLVSLAEKQDNRDFEELMGDA